MIRRLLAAVFVLSAVGCSEVPAAGDKALASVRAEFSKRLAASQGEIQFLQTTPDHLTVKWTSGRCEMLEGEVIDFLISLHRGHPSKVSTDIRAERSCGGATRMFQATAAHFELYRAGHINDVAILRGLQ